MKIGLVPMALIFVLGNVAFGNTHSDYNKSFDFAKLKTWDFANSKVNTSDLVGKNPLWDDELRQALVKHFQMGGFTQNSANPDFLVRYHLGTREKLSVDVYRERFPEFVRYRRGFVYWKGWGRTEVFTTPYDETTLVIDILDAKTRQLVWRGYDTKTINLNKTEKGLDISASELIKIFEKDVRKAEKRNG